ncbi:claudin-34-like isoform 1-T2 [Salvelinus alpinus]|uniref:claudin-34 n=1 Tax=Salvelinus sp. IW2-2015 TaxID=2691554 RepID=UPI000CEAF284|nr:claudin-34-like [Salvelinus alpinus]
MVYLAHTVHWQFLGLVIGCVGWILTMATAGHNEWRLWYVEDVSVVTSGVAWVGVWRACFYSHTLPDSEFCQPIGIADPFVPVEISVAQVVIMVAVITGLLGNILGAYSVRNIYFGQKTHDFIRLTFSGAGGLYVLTGVSFLVPLVWNVKSVLTNQTVAFPPEFHLPPAPLRQEVGGAIWMGVGASIFLIFGGLLFLCYRYVIRAKPVSGENDKDPLHGPPIRLKSILENGDKETKDNPAFQAEEDL